jgi:hypothetical protein
MWRCITVLAIITWTGCGGTAYHPPAHAPERQTSSEVAAPFDTTWSVVVELFAIRRLPIARIDKTSGLVMASPIAVHPSDADRWADCGFLTDPERGRLQFLADRVDFGVLVRPMGDSSLVIITATWLTGSHASGECRSRNIWEPALVQTIKEAAERKHRMALKTVLRDPDPPMNHRK